MKPRVIVAFPHTPALAAAKAAPETPIVVPTGEPLAAGLVKSLAHPGGMITGLSNVGADITEKDLEFLIAAMPQLRRVGFLADSTNLARAALKDAAHRSVVRYSIEEAYEEVGGPEEIAAAILRLAREGSQALIAIQSPIIVSERRRIIKLAAAQQCPVVGWSSEWPNDGALLSYGVNGPDLFRRAAGYVDKILKGANPGDLPIEQPTKFELVINLKTAKALGLDVPLHLQQLANQVIE